MSFRNYNNREYYRKNNNYNNNYNSNYNNDRYNNNKTNRFLNNNNNNSDLDRVLKEIGYLKSLVNTNNFLISKLETRMDIFEKINIKNMFDNIEKNNKNYKKLSECKNDEDDINIEFNVFENLKLINSDEKNFFELDKKINKIDDLIDLANKFNDEENTYYFDSNKNLHFYNNQYYSFSPIKIKNILKPLNKLKNLIGINEIKDSIINFITTYLSEEENKNMLHTIIEGPPGVGKTRLGKILAEIYSGLGIVNSNRFKLVKRSDLVGQYAGETVNKTQKVLDESEGGVLFIDEAYSLGSDGNDLYSKECIDCINQNLTEKKKNLIVIIAGYENSLERYFFSKNEGLKRRFPFKYKIKGYDKKELKEIFLLGLKYKKIKLDSSTIDESKIIKLFEENSDILKNFGGDIENLINYCELNTNRDNFGKHPSLKKIITFEILKKSIKDYSNVINNEENNNWKHMIYI